MNEKFENSGIDRVLPTEEQVDEIVASLLVVDKTADKIIESGILEAPSETC